MHSGGSLAALSVLSSRRILAGVNKSKAAAAAAAALSLNARASELYARNWILPAAFFAAAATATTTTAIFSCV